MDRRAWLDRQLAFPKPDTRPIWQWAHDNIAELPAAYAIRGRFDVANSPWLRAPFESMTDPACRHTTVSKAVQSGGTLLAEISAAWRIANDPGPMTFTCQSIEMATLESKTRMMPLLESVPAVARLLPRAGPLRTQTEIFFPGGGFLVMNSANLAHQQSQSVKNKINDEIWMPAWADVYDHACARVTAFEQQGTSHILDISQGGYEGDKAEWSFNQGTREYWSVLCAMCAKPHELAFHLEMGTPHWKEKKGDEKIERAGVVWSREARKDDGMFDEVMASETCAFVCPHCGHRHEDNDATREHWRKTGHYISPRENPPKDWRSFHWEALVAHPMRLLVLEFCRAENQFTRIGDEEPRITFRQKREARSWKVKRQTLDFSIRELAGYSQETFRSTKIPNEAARVMFIDKQMTHYWVEIGAFTADPEYTQLFFGRVDTRDAVREIQKLYGVMDGMVGQDRRYKPEEVDKDCALYGWRGMMGASQQYKTWRMENETTKLMEEYPHSDPKLASVGGGQSVYFYEYATGYMKDILVNALAGKGMPWHLPDDVNPVWIEHQNSEEKIEVKSGKWEWREVKQNANHGRDTSAAIVAMGIIMNLIRYRPPTDKQK